MKALIACEYSGTVRDAFLAQGADAWSNDILPTESNPSRHIQGDCLSAIGFQRWDLIILHIPCTAMCLAGNRHYGRGKPKHHERLQAIDWTLDVWDAACEYADHVVLENPASVIFPILSQQRPLL